MGGSDDQSDTDSEWPDDEHSESDFDDDFGKDSSGINEEEPVTLVTLTSILLHAKLETIHELKGEDVIEFATGCSQAPVKVFASQRVSDGKTARSLPLGQADQPLKKRPLLS